MTQKNILLTKKNFSGLQTLSNPFIFLSLNIFSLSAKEIKSQKEENQ